MKSFLEAAYGIPSDVQAAVNTDVDTALRSLAALDRAIEAAPHDALLTRYRAAIQVIAHDRLTRGRINGIRTHAAIAADEANAIRRGGGQ